MILQPSQPSTPSKHHWGQSCNNHLHHSFYSFHVYIAPWEVSCHVFTMPRMNHQKQCVYPCHYVGCTIVERRKEGLPTELGKHFQYFFFQNGTIFCNSKMVLKFIVGLTILELLIKRWKKIVLDNTTVSQKASKTAWPTGNSYAIFGFPGLYF